VVACAEAAALREEVGRELGDILRRGLVDGTVRAGLTPLDLIVMATMVAQPLPYVTDWGRVARRAADVHPAGMSPGDGRETTDGDLR
jgi:hypothetical protein